MRLFLCEKPSQAKDIAKVVGATKRADGCLIGQSATVTWCVGHLLETAPPEIYDERYKKWSLNDLPILPQQWKMVVKSQTKAQFNIVKKLLAKTTELVIATDADREGEMIARELIEYCGYKGKVFRLWLSALNDASIRKALSELRAGTETLSMYYAALTRSRSDWLIGMNMSRLFTLLGRQSGYDGILSVGRVQTPTLGLVVKRDREIAHFVSKPYWTINVGLNSSGENFIASWQPPQDITDDAGRCINLVVAQETVKRFKQPQLALVKKVETQRIKEAPPLVFDLGTLQEICSRKFDLGAQETLDIAQSLYEKHKATTYPRSDCSYLPESMLTDIPAVLHALIKTDPAVSPLISKLDKRLRSRVWNDKKITAHHGIIPTLEAVNLTNMTDDELNVYKLIRSHYLAQFMPNHEYDRTTIKLTCAGEELNATGKQIVVIGWHSLMKSAVSEEEKESKSQVLPKLSEGIQCQINGAELNSMKTQPPKPYTEGELIKAMKNIAKLVTDPRLKQKLKETAGIGTEATRAGIIKGLRQRGYLITKNKAVRATDAAFTLIDAVPPAIVDPGMTALWEQALENIITGQMTMDSFLSKQSVWITQLIEKYSNSSLNIKPTQTPSCPLCHSSMRKRSGQNGQFWSCSKYPACSGVQNIVGSSKKRSKAKKK